MTDRPDFTELYRAALRDAIRSGAEEALANAAELGQAAVDAGDSLALVLSAHNEIVVEALSALAASLVVERAGAFLSSFLAPVERAYVDLRATHQALVEQKRAIEQLPEVFLEGIPAMIYVAPWQGQPGEMLYVSPQAEAILGFAAPDWIARSTPVAGADRPRGPGARAGRTAAGPGAADRFRLRVSPASQRWTQRLDPR